LAKPPLRLAVLAKTSAQDGILDTAGNKTGQLRLHKIKMARHKSLTAIESGVFMSCGKLKKTRRHRSGAMDRSPAGLSLKS